MPEVTLESLAARVAVLEAKLAEQESARPEKDWLQTIGMFADSELMEVFETESAAIREAEREAARRGDGE